MNIKFVLSMLLLILLSGCYSDEYEKMVAQSKSASPDRSLLTSVYAGKPPVNIIPKPSSISQSANGWIIDERVTITYDASFEFEASYLADKLKSHAGITLKTQKNTKSALKQIDNTIELKMDTSTNSLADEGYTLTINHGKAQIKANHAAGIFYGVQSLIQLMPLTKEKVIPFVQIIDKPKFKWRGLMMDSARHFYSVTDTKKILDTMAFHKLNKFHWHLTDDQGWRIEIKKYPLLTNTGSCRASTPPYGANWAQDNQQYCRFYTQAEIKDIVAYAEARHIEVIPEINLPGHMSAAIASMPELGVIDAEEFNSGLKVQTDWGLHPYLLSTDTQTFEWLNNVFTEVSDLFPNSSYIHIGGDNTDKSQWKTSNSTKYKMDLEGITPGTEDRDLHAWFIKKAANIIESKGKKTIGWADILVDTQVPDSNNIISTDTVIIALNSYEMLNKAARKGHLSILSYGASYDYYQEPKSFALKKGVEYESKAGFLSLEDAYNFSPIPITLESQYHNNVIGGQALLWSQYAHTSEKAEYLIFPRLAALSEAVWSSANDRSYTDFLTRMPNIQAHYDARKINYGPIYNSDFIELLDGTIAHTTMNIYGMNALWAIKDDDLKTYFSSNASPKVGETITFDLNHSLSDGYINIETGILNADNVLIDYLQHGVLETSYDGEVWNNVGTFENGNVLVKFTDSIKHIRIKVTKDQSESWLKISEIIYGNAIKIAEDVEIGAELVQLKNLFNVPESLAEPKFEIITGNENRVFFINSSTTTLLILFNESLNYEPLLATNTLVMKLGVTLLSENIILEYKTLFFEITDVDENGTWEESVVKNFSIDKPVFLTDKIITSQNIMKIDLSSLTGDQVTYEVFVRPENTVQQMAAIFLYDDGCEYLVSQMLYSNIYGMSAKSNIGYGYTPYQFIPQPNKSVTTLWGVISHVVYVVDTKNNVTKLYVNGDLTGTMNAACIIKGAVSFLGGNPVNFLAQGDKEVVFSAAMYNSALTAEAIQARYEAYNQ